MFLIKLSRGLVSIVSNSNYNNYKQYSVSKVRKHNNRGLSYRISSSRYLEWDCHLQLGLCVDMLRVQDGPVHVEDDVCDGRVPGHGGALPRPLVTIHWASAVGCGVVAVD